MTTTEVVLSALRLARSTYSFAFILAVVSFIPGLNIVLYSGHGGPGWLLLPLALPYALVRLGLTYRAATPNRRPYVWRFGVYSVLVYVVASFAASFLGAWAIHWWSGLIVEPAQIWALYMSPIGLLYFVL